jgi:hypothetical protein
LLGGFLVSEEAKLRIEPLPDSKIRISIIGASKFELDPVAAAHVIGLILEAAKEAHGRTGEPLPDFTKNQAIWAVLRASAFGLGPSQLPNHESLLMQFGETVLSLPIEKTKLRQLGEAMVALSADSDRGH